MIKKQKPQNICKKVTVFFFLSKPLPVKKWMLDANRNLLLFSYSLLDTFNLFSFIVWIIELIFSAMKKEKIKVSRNV
jgi:hypothetical protein